MLQRKSWVDDVLFYYYYINSCQIGAMGTVPFKKGTKVSKSSECEEDAREEQHRVNGPLNINDIQYTASRAATEHPLHRIFNPERKKGKTLVPPTHC